MNTDNVSKACHTITTRHLQPQHENFVFGDNVTLKNYSGQWIMKGKMIKNTYLYTINLLLFFFFFFNNTAYT